MNYFDQIIKDLNNPSFQQKIFIKRKTLDFESIKFLLNNFWNMDAINNLSELVSQNQKELYLYSIEMGYIDSTMTFDEFVKQ